MDEWAAYMNLGATIGRYVEENIMTKRFLTTVILGIVVTAILGGCSANRSLSPSNASLEPVQQTEGQAELPLENEGSGSSNEAAESDVHKEQDVGSKAADSQKALTIDDYMTMNDSLDTFTDFVNRRTDFTAEEKKKIIDARSRQLEITAELMKEYKAILTDEEMEAYLVQPVGEALEAGVLPVNDTYDQAVKKIEAAKKDNSEISKLSEQLKEVQGGLLKTFTDKVQKEKSKLLGF